LDITKTGVKSDETEV